MAATSRELWLARAALAACVWALPPPAVGVGQQAGEAEQEGSERAYELFERSAELYREGRFAEAAAKLERAYELEPQPVLLYNLARAYESMGRLEDAIDTYTKYIRQDPDAEDRGAIEARIRTLEHQRERMTEAERRAAAERRRADTAPPQPPEREERSPGRVAAPWIVTGVGVLVVGAGVGLGLRAESLHDDAVDEPDVDEAIALQDDAETSALAANVSFAVGGAIAVAGVSWLLADRIGGGDGESAGASLAPGPGLAGVAVRARW